MTGLPLFGVSGLLAAALCVGWGATVAAQGPSRGCARLASEANAQLGRFDQAAGRLVLSTYAKECHQRLGELAQLIEGMERTYTDLRAGSCTVDRRLEPEERRRASDRIKRWEAGCDRLEEPARPELPQRAGPPVETAGSPADPPHEAAPAVQQAQQRSPEAQQAPRAGAQPARPALPPHYSTLAMVFLALLALVVLSVLLGRLSAKPRLPGRGRELGPITARDPDAAAPAPRSNSRERIDLVPVEGGPPYPVESWRLDGPGITVGRDPALCDVVVADRHVSSRHARIWRDRDGLHIQDLGSTNGVWREGRRVLTATLVGGELIRLGDTTFRLAVPRS